MKVFIQTLFTQDHVESVIRSGLKVVGTYLTTHGMLAADGKAQFISGGVVLATGFVMSFIDKLERKQDAASIIANAPTFTPPPPPAFTPPQPPSAGIIKSN